uniref:Uncharacterized protein n=1 Tax=Podoviridae sp. ct8Lf7 TaxID=2827723 RepID=A0A8S5S0S9_9CAUD|nr:MAG TPA: hypothetical protein [Podoviridae sp. ct8Lf7]
MERNLSKHKVYSNPFFCIFYYLILIMMLLW